MKFKHSSNTWSFLLKPTSALDSSRALNASSDLPVGRRRAPASGLAGADGCSQSTAVFVKVFRSLLFESLRASSLSLSRSRKAAMPAQPSQDDPHINKSMEELRQMLQAQQDMNLEARLAAELDISSRRSIEADEVLTFLETQLTCSLCNKIYIQPHVITCCHTFCAPCLKQLLQLKQGQEEPQGPYETFDCTPCCPSIGCGILIEFPPIAALQLQQMAEDLAHRKGLEIPDHIELKWPKPHPWMEAKAMARYYQDTRRI
ncbi:hypothetical protein E1B28_010751 [Marasmius oreades]|uniref:RING-type domain-containing protein n=1 Tax=Marasmius oreades TaxID=181124 RepID=A0A9P7UQI0_9AGAR|nr:uncharacterized protein E1B28_010751 [Marasmius oreades]KAG7089041.1 hypothetical protein E1B28_010751 [Marasmius oreades]